MKKVKKAIFVLAVLNLFVSCRQLSDVSSEVSNTEIENKTAEELAQKYVKYKSVWTNFENGRSATDTRVNEYPDFLFCIELSDENGNPVKFEDFSEEQKEQFYSAWQEEEIKYCVELLDNNEELQKQVLLDNLAMEEALKAAERNVFVDNSYSMFLKKYLNARKTLLEENDDNLQTARGSSSSYGEITKDCLNTASVEKLKAIYKKGLVLYTPDAAGSSTGYFTGHAAITKEDKWDSDWESNGLARISISAWGDSKPTWKGKTNGVQEEPLGFWAGKSQSSAKYVEVFQMCYPKVVVKFKWFIPYPAIEYVSAPSGDAEKAAKYANDQIGKPYGIGGDIAATIGGNLTVKWKTNNFYCSQLVWRSWVSASPIYDFSAFRPMVLPADFELAMNTRMLASFHNK